MEFLRSLIDSGIPQRASRRWALSVVYGSTIFTLMMFYRVDDSYIVRSDRISRCVKPCSLDKMQIGVGLSIYYCADTTSVL